MSDQKLRYFAIVGRVPYDSEDTTLIFQATDLDAAEKLFATQMTEAMSEDDITHHDEVDGTNDGVYVIGAYVSDSPIEMA